MPRHEGRIGGFVPDNSPGGARGVMVNQISSVMWPGRLRRERCSALERALDTFAAAAACVSDAGKFPVLFDRIEMRRHVFLINEALWSDLARSRITGFRERAAMRLVSLLRCMAFASCGPRVELGRDVFMAMQLAVRRTQRPQSIVGRNLIDTRSFQ